VSKSIGLFPLKHIGEQMHILKCCYWNQIMQATSKKRMLKWWNHVFINKP